MSNDRFRFRVFDNDYKDYLPLSDCQIWALTGKLIKQSLFQPNRYCIEQCTGLKDKNGKLIFEGDVLQDGENVAAVVWNIDQYLLEYRDGYVGDFSLFAKTFEVVGNIHEGSWINE